MNDPYTIATVVGVTYVVSGIVVAFDPFHRKRLLKALKPLPLFLVPAALAFVVWLSYMYGSEVLNTVVDTLGITAMSRATDRSNNPLIVILGILFKMLLALFWLGLVAVVFVGLPLLILITLLPAVGQTFLVLPTLVTVPLIALYLIGRETIFFVAKPKAVRDVEKTLQSEKTHQEAAAKASKILEEETLRKVAQTRWWKLNLGLIFGERHNRLLARYLRSMEDLMRAVNDHLEGKNRGK